MPQTAKSEKGFFDVEKNGGSAFGVICRLYVYNDLCPFPLYNFCLQSQLSLMREPFLNTLPHQETYYWFRHNKGGEKTLFEP